MPTLTWWICLTAAVPFLWYTRKHFDFIRLLSFCAIIAVLVGVNVQLYTQALRESIGHATSQIEESVHVGGTADGYRDFGVAYRIAGASGDEGGSHR